MLKNRDENINKQVPNILTSDTLLITSNAAVTLVALVITIIVLLILSGVTLNMVMGDNGIIKKAQLAKDETRKSTIIEIADRTALEEKSKAPMEEDSKILENTMNSLKNNEELNQIGDITTTGKFLIVDKSIFEIDIKKGTKYNGEQTGNDIILSDGDIKFTYIPEEPTNQNVKVKIEVNTTAIKNPTIQYKTENEEWKEYKQEIEVEKNCDIYVRLQSIEGNSTVATGTIANIDKLEPKEFTPKVTATSNSIEIEAKAEDQEKTEEYACSGIEGYKFSKDNGNTWTEEYQESGTYKFEKLTQNTTYSIVVEAKDKAGNTKQAKISAGTGEVEGIQTGDVVFTSTPSEITKENVEVEITGNKTGMQLQYKTEKSGKTGEVSNWTNYTGKITLERNQDIYARVVDSEGQAGQTYATGTIANIDKLPPNSFTPTLTATHNSVEVTASTTDQAKTSDNASSGNIQYRFSKDNGSSWTSYQTSGSYTFTGLSAGTTYNIKVEAKDKVGNTTQGSRSITTKKTYTISYNANGGSGAPANQTKIQGTNIKLSSTKPTRSGYLFAGWGTSASATKVTYAAGATYSTDANLSLYAIWQLNVTFTKGSKISVTANNSSFPDTNTSASLKAGDIVKFKFSGNVTGVCYVHIYENGNNLKQCYTSETSQTYTVQSDGTVKFAIVGGGSGTATLTIESIVDKNGNAKNITN